MADGKEVLHSQNAEAFIRFVFDCLPELVAHYSALVVEPLLVQDLRQISKAVRLQP